MQRHANEFRDRATAAGALTLLNLQGDEEAKFWQRVTNGPYEMATLSEADTAMKLSVLPSHFETLIAAIERAADQHEMALAMLLRGPGVVYVTLSPDEHDDKTVGLLAKTCQAIFEAAQTAGGHGFIERCPTELKRAINIWGATREDLPLMQTAGYSDTKPRDSNGSSAGRSRNRRVEIVVLPAQRQ